MKAILTLCALLFVNLPVLAQEAASEADQATAAGEAAAGTEDMGALIAKEHNIGVLMGVALSAREKGDLAIMEQAALRLHQLRPKSAEFGMLLIRAYALQDKKTKAYDLLVRMEKQGLYLDLDAEPDLENIRGTELYLFLVHSFGINAEPIGEAATAAQLQRDDLLINSLVWDPINSGLLVGSVADGTVYRVGAGGALDPFITPDDDNALLGIFDLAIDRERDVLWLSANAVAHYRNVRFQDVGRSGVWKFRLSTGEYLTRIEAPTGGGFVLADLQVLPDGSVLVANSSSPVILKIDPEAREMRRFMSAPNLTSVRAMALSPDGARLYFADYDLGLFSVELETQKAVAIRAPAEINLSGVDDLYALDQSLILVQNASAPNRVMRLTLAEDKVSAKQLDTLLSGLPEFDAPSVGALSGSNFYVVSSSDWNAYDPQSGRPREGVELDAPKILVVDVNTVSQAQERLFDPEEAKRKAGLDQG